MRVFYFILIIFILASCKNLDIDKEIAAGKRQYKNDSLTQSIITFSKVIAKTDTSYQSFLYRGFAYKGLKQYENAINDFTSLINIDKKDGVGYANRASIYYKLNDYTKALRDFQLAFQFDTTQLVLCNPISHMLFFTGQKDSACFYYLKCIRNGDTTFDHEISEYCSKQQ